ncbi:WEB family protein At2g38370-like [Phalaenopsis equestris]|uniref:WEB family protein At2g38370-like n=1 Tax=Phalaenopsis equestris TaxID=78828 RepID=UPI0009E4968A|nr:WEB family protein At2g38370-like [Phalaenopsis equestris]
MDATKAPPFSEKEKALPVEALGFGEKSRGRRGEVDTSAPFGSVKEAVERFGGSAVWNSQLKMLFLPEKRHRFEEFKVLNVEKQADQSEKGLFVRELEVPKRIIHDFEYQLQKEETSEVNKISMAPSSSQNFHPFSKKEKDNLSTVAMNAGTVTGQSSGYILDELELAKMNLSRTTCDLTKIRAFIEALYNEIDSERTIQEKTPEKLSSLGTIVSFLEEDLKKTTLQLQIKNDNLNRNSADISREIEQLRSQTEQFRQTATAAKSEASNLTSEIEMMQAGIKTAEIRKLAAKKMEEAAKAAEAVAVARIKDIMNGKSSKIAPEEHYGSSRKKIEAFSSMADVETPNLPKLELLTKVKEAAAEVNTSRKALEEALTRLEAVNSGKIHSSSINLMDCSYSKMIEFNGFDLANHTTSKSRFKHAPSIGEILSKKIMGLEEICVSPDEKDKAKVSLGQILNRKPGLLPPLLIAGFARKQQPSKRKGKKSGFGGYLILNNGLKQSIKN